MKKEKLPKKRHRVINGVIIERIVEYPYIFDNKKKNETAEQEYQKEIDIENHEYFKNYRKDTLDDEENNYHNKEERERRYKYYSSIDNYPEWLKDDGIAIPKYKNDFSDFEEIMFRELKIIRRIKDREIVKVVFHKK